MVAGLPGPPRDVPLAVEEEVSPGPAPAQVQCPAVVAGGVPDLLQTS